MLYLGVKGSYPEISHHTIYISRDYGGNLQDITKHYRLSQDPSFYVQNASITDSSLAPAGHSALYCLFPVPHQHRNLDWSALQHSFRETALDQLRRIGLPDLRDRIVYEKVFTPLDWEGMEVYRGATFSLAHNLGQMLHLRPHNRFEELDGVYLAGGGTHPGSGLPVIFSSARISSALLCQDLGLQADWNPPLAMKREVVSR
jgi:phytoene desaturase